MRRALRRPRILRHWCSGVAENHVCTHYVRRGRCISPTGLQQGSPAGGGLALHLDAEGPVLQIAVD